MTNVPKSPDHDADKPAKAPAAPVMLPDEKQSQDAAKPGSNSHEAAKPIVTPAPQKN